MRPLRLTLVTLALSLFSTTAMAKTDIGVLAGFNFAKLSIEGTGGTDLRGAFLAGGLADFGLNDRFGIRVEPTFMSKGGTSTKRNAYWGTNDGATFKLNCIDIPVLARYDLAETPSHGYLIGGVGVSIGTDYKVDLSQGNNKATVDFGDIMNPVDVTADVGFGVSAPVGANRMTFDARATFGLVNINNGGTVTVNGSPLTVPSTSVHTADFRLVASYLFPMK